MSRPEIPEPVEETFHTIRAGMWVAVVGRHQRPEDAHAAGGYDPMLGYIPARAVTWSGQPCRVVATSQPFLCVDPDGDPAQRTTIDLRELQVVELKPGYVRAMRNRLKAAERADQPLAAPVLDPPTPRPCCQCGHLMKITPGQNRATGERAWIVACTHCGHIEGRFDGGNDAPALP